MSEIGPEIPLNQQNRNLLTKAMVLIQTGKEGADQVQQLIETGLLGVDEGKLDKHGLAQGVTAAIINRLIRATIMPEVNELKKGESSIEKNNLINKTIKARSIVNDQVSARYLDQVLHFLQPGQEITNFNPDEIAPIEFPLVDHKESYYYGSTGGSFVAHEIKRELGLAA